MRTQTKIMPTHAKGTFNYMSPEAFETVEAGGAGVGPPADVWSMACVMVEMHSGSPPWVTMQLQQIMMAVGIRKRTPDVADDSPAAATLWRAARRRARQDPARLLRADPV